MLPQSGVNEKFQCNNIIQWPFKRETQCPHKKSHLQTKMEIRDKKKNRVVRQDTCSIPSRSIFQESQARQTDAPGLSEKECCAHGVSIMATSLLNHKTQRKGKASALKTVVLLIMMEPRASDKLGKHYDIELHLLRPSPELPSPGPSIRVNNN